MLAPRRAGDAPHDPGFTLVEVLVVMIIIGILAAVAIPVFIRQRKAGWDDAVKADLRNAATAQETFMTQNGLYSIQTPAGTQLSTVGFHYSDAVNYDPTAGRKIVVENLTSATAKSTTATSTGYCLKATSASGTTFYFNSMSTGFTTTACP